MSKANMYDLEYYQGKRHISTPLRNVPYPIAKSTKNRYEADKSWTTYNSYFKIVINE